MVCLALALASGPVAAGTPDHLSDLLYQDYGWAAEQLRERGYTEKSVAEFDRDYRDGLHHDQYHDYNDTTAYSDGYNAGQRDRDEKTTHRSRYGHHSGYHS